LIKSLGASRSPAFVFVYLGIKEIKKVMTRDRMILALREKGVDVRGTTKDFGLSDGGIWISGESTPSLFDYYSERWMDTFGVQPKLNDFVEENGWYFEWYDAGTMMVWLS
jgi:hypothetical protein